MGSNTGIRAEGVPIALVRAATHDILPPQKATTPRVVPTAAGRPSASRAASTSAARSPHHAPPPPPLGSAVIVCRRSPCCGPRQPPPPPPSRTTLFPQTPYTVNPPGRIMFRLSSTGVDKGAFIFGGMNSEFRGFQIPAAGRNICHCWSFVSGSRAVLQSKALSVVPYKKSFCPSASWMTGSQIASNAFTLGTIAVLPFYTLMVVAPNSKLTKKSMDSNLPYVGLGVAYAYLLYLSWTPDTMRLMFASKYWLPQLPSIAKMFSNEMTLASAWLHLLLVDLFAARQIFFDGVKNKIETRHSVSLCLFFCPVGIVAHAITKLLTGGSEHRA